MLTSLSADIFSDGPPRPPIIHDVEDGVDRCGLCTSEVVGGYCQNAAWCVSMLMRLGS